MTGSKHPRIVLQTRDQHLLEELQLMRIIDREQAKVVAGFHSTTRANTRLLALTRGGFLKRVFLGGHQAAYQLAGTTLPHGTGQPATLFASHQLAINSIYLMIKYRAVPLKITRLVRWLRFEQSLSKTLPLIPDGYFELDSSGEIRPLFLEVDLGTEALPIWQRKTQLYLQLALSGEFASIFAQPQFRVLVVANTERRLAHIRATVAQSTTKIFWFSSFETLNRESFWSSVWLRPAGDQRLPLL